MKALVYHATRGRPQKVQETVTHWFNRATGVLTFDYVLGVEESELDLYADCIMNLTQFDGFRHQVLKGNRVEIDDLYKDYQSSHVRPRNPKFPTEDQIKAGMLTANNKFNALVKSNPDYDWYITSTDDTWPVHNWDLMMLEYLERYKGKVAMLGYIPELLRTLVSHPIFTKEFYKFNNEEVMYSGYFHCCGDCELYLLGVLSGCLYGLPEEIYLQHNNPHFGTAKWDDLYKINYCKEGLDQDNEIWQKRKAELKRRYGDNKA